jgi:hypothetical protein
MISLHQCPLPDVDFVPARRSWRLNRDFLGRVDGHWWCIPGPWDFDMASVPRCLWWAIAPFELGTRGPFCHDQLYRCGGNLPRGRMAPHRKYTRAETDRLFLELMAAEGVIRWRRVLAYVAVRAFGWKAWRPCA